jgi:hypothetical protein
MHTPPEFSYRSKSTIIDNKFRFGINPGGNRIAFENFTPYNQLKQEIIR